MSASTSPRTVAAPAPGHGATARPAQGRAVGTSRRKVRRANRVRELRAAAIAAFAGMYATLSPAAPTGRPVVDAILTGTSVAVVVYAAASAPWWAVAAAGGAAMAVGMAPLLFALGAVALLIGLWIGAGQRSAPTARGVGVGIALNALAWSALDIGPFGSSALLAIAVAGMVVVTGLLRRPRRVRRVAWTALGVVGLATVIALVGFGAAATRARDELRAGQSHVDAGVAALEAGDVEQAAAEFDAASRSLTLAGSELGDPLMSAASLVPVVSQNRAVALDVVDAAARSTARVGAALHDIDPSRLRFNAGGVDLAAVAAVRDRLHDIDVALGDLTATIDQPRSPWTVTPVTQRLDAVGDRLAAAAPRVGTAWRAASALPGLLGADGPRTYLVLFTTPAEARGLGGFLGYVAELRADRGRVSMVQFFKTSDLEVLGDALGTKVNAPAEFLERYRDWGYAVDPDGTVGQAPFRNLTETPNFPWVAEVAADLYSQIAQVRPDGVIAVDPYTIGALLGYTDGIELTSVGQALSSDNVADYLIRGQYLTTTDNEQRVDAMGEAAEKTIEALLEGSLPDIESMARDLGPLVEERRLMMWSADPLEQDLLRGLGLLGEIPSPDGSDGWSVAVTNGSGNKIDAFLDRRANYESSTDPATGVTTGHLRVQLTNSAPASGLPDYVIGNSVGLPTGTSRLIVSFYTPLAVTEMTRDGTPVAIAASREVGWNVFTTTIDIPAGGTASFDLVMSGQLARPDRVVTWTQPLAAPMGTLD